MDTICGGKGRKGTGGGGGEGGGIGGGLVFISMQSTTPNSLDPSGLVEMWNIAKWLTKLFKLRYIRKMLFNVIFNAIFILDNL